ncbi:hypothetical protein [Candidatus Magnetomonas plexicatena]|uniref:hypothetical protein n=1 Tax=Candidatus Magnetomonas plexicatena TaxID=2552947 RepID=UPI001102048E|nr:hypothetical protein E2O03_007050 [Nitrospirales bacterium LBB_01]
MRFKKIPVCFFVLLLSCGLLVSVSQAEKRKKTYSQKDIEDIEKQTEKQLDNKTNKINPQAKPTATPPVTTTTALPVVAPAIPQAATTAKTPVQPVQTVSVEDVGDNLDTEKTDVRSPHSNILAFASRPDEPAYPELKRGKIAYGILSVLSPFKNDNTTPLSDLTAPLPYSMNKNERMTVHELLNRASTEIVQAGLTSKSGIVKPYILTGGNDFHMCPANGGKLYGIFIGVQTYKMDTSMVNSYSKNDVLDFQNAISNLCANTSIHVFIDDNATIGAIYESLADIKQMAAQKDSFLFYYSGFSSIREGIGYMFLPGTINDKVLIKNTSLDFNSLFDFSQTLRASNIMFFIDTAALVRELLVVQ